MTDRTLQAYCTRKRWTVDSLGIIHLTRAQANSERLHGYLEFSIRDAGRHTLLVQSDSGTVLLLEGKHFVID